MFSPTLCREPFARRAEPASMAESVRRGAGGCCVEEQAWILPKFDDVKRPATEAAASVKAASQESREQLKQRIDQA